MSVSIAPPQLAWNVQSQTQPNQEVTSEIRITNPTNCESNSTFHLTIITYPPMYDYERSLFEFFDTIIVDHTPLTEPLPFRAPERILKTKTERMPRIAVQKRDSNTKKRKTDDETETEVSGSGDAKSKKSITGSKKRKMGPKGDGDAKNQAAKLRQQTDSEIDGKRKTVKSTSIPIPEEIKSRAKLPPMGQFILGGRSASGEFLSSGHRKEDSAITGDSDDTDELSLQRDLSLKTLTQFPPPNEFYGGVPRCNSQWVICIRPRKPTYYHPSWSVAQRREADSRTKEFVKHGEKTIKRDKGGKVYHRLVKEKYTEDTYHLKCGVTPKSVFWWQCHWYRGRQHWVVNAALDGYDEYLDDGKFDKLVGLGKVEPWSGYPPREQIQQKLQNGKV